MKNKKLGRIIFSLVMSAIILVLVFIMSSGILKTDNEYWIVFTLLYGTVIVGIPIMIIMVRKNVLEAEEKRVKKMIDKNNGDKHDENKYKQKKLVDNLYKYREHKLSKLKMQLIRTITDISDSRLDKTASEKTLLEQMIKIISEALTDKEQTEFDKLFDLFVAEKDKSRQLLLALKDKKVQTYADYHITIFKSLDAWLKHNGYTEEMINDVYKQLKSSIKKRALVKKIDNN